MSCKYLTEFGGRGYGPGWFNFPTDLAINKRGQLIVADLFNKRVQVLDVEYIKPEPAAEDKPDNESEWEISDGEVPSPEQDEAAPGLPADSGATLDLESPFEAPPGSSDTAGELEAAPEGLLELPDGVIEEDIIEQER
jgi:hypothetical protein